MRGPTSPVCRAGTPCTAPAGGTELVFTQGDTGVSAMVAKDGSYFVSLKPGTYTVTASSQQLVGRGIEPSSIVVRSGPREKRDFRIDTGIR